MNASREPAAKTAPGPLLHFVNIFTTSTLHKAATVLTAAAVFASCQQLGPNVVNDIDIARTQIAPNLLQLGARNWVVIADPAYPLPAGESVVCINVPTDTTDTFREVLDLLELEGAVVPRIWTSYELSAMPESRAPGVKEHRKKLEQLLLGRFHYEVNSRIIDMQLARAAKEFRVLYIRTRTRLPYSHIAIELDSGYWNSDAETEIRKRVQELFPPLIPEQSPEQPSGTTDITTVITA